MFGKKIIFLFIFLAKTSFCPALLQPQDLSLEERIGQLLLVHFHGEKANSEAKQLLEKAHIGGFIYYNWSNGLTSPAQVRELCSSLQQMNKELSSKIPLFLAVDQEGGRVIRLKTGFTHFPSNREIAETERSELAYETAKITAQELKAVGINMNLAPVIDVKSSSSNGIIGSRSYGSDPEQVFRFGEQSLKGYQSENILAVLKHFPGYGDVSIDPHSATPRVTKSLEELEKTDLFPFQHLCPQADALMTGHLIVTSIDPIRPATVSTPLLTDRLRKQWGYEGLILSDSLLMKGILSENSAIEQVALLTLQAGTDILCLGGKLLNESSEDELTALDVLRIHAFLVEAVRKEILSEKRVDESVARILKIKEKYALSQDISTKDLSVSVGTRESSQLVQEIAILNHVTISLSKEVCKKIAEHIWQNESGRSPDKILFWNPQEPFLSLGIAHMIWYPSSSKAFEEGFSKYLTFLQRQEATFPSWLTPSSACPWKSREEFMFHKNSSQAHELKQWLLSTFDLQAQYLIYELKNTLYLMIQAAPGDKKQKLLTELSALISSPSGLYALTDYLNFKGSGLAAPERYQNKGWGLFQVLTGMSSEEDTPCIERFIQSASTVLTQRVQNAPASRNEDKWLKGWLNRIQDYRCFLVTP